MGIEIRLRSDEIDLASLYRARPGEVRTAVERAVRDVVGPTSDFVVHLAPGSLVARITVFFRKAGTKLGGRAAEAPGVGPVPVDTEFLQRRVDRHEQPDLELQDRTGVRARRAVGFIPHE